MNKTVQEFRRESIKQLFVKILQTKILRLEPKSALVEESFNSDFTAVNLTISKRECDSKSQIQLEEKNGKGFVDGIFKSCSRFFLEDYPSLENIRLKDYRVRPSFKKIKSKQQSDAEVQVTVAMEVKERGTAEFTSTSRSILHSTLVATLEAFEFYINCEKTFHEIQIILTDANNRNRGDIVQACVSDLSKLTEVNTYDKKEKN